MSDRRIVVCHSGGMRRIIGVIAGTVAPAHLPQALSGMVGHDMAVCALSKVEPRYVMYREVVPASDSDGA